MQRARQSLGNACLIVFGGQNRAFQLVQRASALQLAVNTLELADSSRAWGSVHVPDVLVFADAEGRRVVPWRVSMIYAHAPPDVLAEGQPSATVHSESCLLEVRARLLNALRIARRHGYSELVVGDLWSFGGAAQPGGVELTQVLEVVREILRLDHDLGACADVAGAFRRITLMAAAEEEQHTSRTMCCPVR